MTEIKIIRVLLVDDHAVVRSGLSTFIGASPDLKVVGEASSGREALQLCSECDPDVVLMDVMMPEMDGIEALRIIRQKHPTVQVLMLTSSSEESVVRAALQAGAVGYVMKNVSIHELADAIRVAVTGKLTLSTEVMQVLVDAARRPAPPTYDLTQRELDVLRLMCKGLNNLDIGEQLFVSRSTVKFHISSILAKLGVANRTEAVALATEQQLMK